MFKRNITMDKSVFPESLQHLLRNAEIYDSSCHSGALVYYADSGYYIKTDAPNRLAREAELSRLFHSRGFGVEVVDYIIADRDYLVTRSAVGEDLTHSLDRPEELCRILAGALRKLHESSAADMPVSLKMQQYLELAKGSRSCNTTLSPNRYGINSTDEAWKLIEEKGRLLAADTAIHGDACLPNVIQHKGSFSAFIDFEMAGLGDRHVDLYWAIWSLNFNLKTDAYADCFLDAYGRELVDEDRLRTVAAFELLG